LGEGAGHCKVGTLCRELWKSAEPLELPFGMLSQVYPRNRVLWVQMPQR